MAKRVLVLCSVLALAGCPYSEGCEGLQADPGTDAGFSPEAPDSGVDADAPDALPRLAPLGGPIEPRCAGLPSVCGEGESCCATADVVGGSFNRANDPSYPATVSSFRLDRFEVTVGRFRAFVKAGMGTQKSPPALGAGAHPTAPGTGWSAEHTAGLPEDARALRTNLACNPDFPAWTEKPGPEDALPMHCVSWFEANAFCIWDGGRLPTETEWNYAAAGGSEQRPFAWGDAALDLEHANWGCKEQGTGAERCAFDVHYLPVGSKSLGNGRWGHSDLTGSVWEWTYDWLTVPPQTTPCNDCVELVAKPGEGDVARRVFRGGGFNWDESSQRTSYRFGDPPDKRFASIGFRCARALE
jgi:sulfatase modifying factor 1